MFLQKKNVEDVNIRDVQLELLKNNGYIQPFVDIKTSHPSFISIQKVGACGILKGTGINIGWENKTLFYPEKKLEKDDLDGLKDYYDLALYPFPEKASIENVFTWIKKVDEKISLNLQDLDKEWKRLGLKNYLLKRNINKAEFAVLIDNFLDPFSRFNIDYNGKLIFND